MMTCRLLKHACGDGMFAFLKRSLKYSCQCNSRNPLGIDMIPEKWNHILFPNSPETSVDKEQLENCVRRILSTLGSSAESDLKTNLPGKSNDYCTEGNISDIPSRFDSIADVVAEKFPPLEGSNLDEHFKIIAHRYGDTYKKLLDKFSKFPLPPINQTWVFRSGWTKYSFQGDHPIAVDYPDDNALILDVEVCVNAGNHPTIAVALSDTAWYSWCSKRLFNPRYHYTNKVDLDDLIPLGRKADDPERIIIGHNVGFDRTFVKEEYFLKSSRLRFWDTMSMHIAVCGLAGDQRVLFMAARKGNRTKASEEALVHTENPTKESNVLGFQNWKWLDVTSTNSLIEVHRFHCPNSGLFVAKELRDLFLVGTMSDIREKFQLLMTYCATDVAATFEVFSMLMDQFWQRFPHPVTFVGMLEMGTSYLPTNAKWQHYMTASDKTQRTFQNQVGALLQEKARQACNLLYNDRYKDDPWLWNENWDVGKEPKRITTFKRKTTETALEYAKRVWDESMKKQNKKSMNRRLPAWYRSLLQNNMQLERWDEVDVFNAILEISSNENAINLSAQMRLAFKLLRVHWNGYPLYFSDAYGWGYLVPGRTSNLSQFEEEQPGRYIVEENVVFPYKSVEAFVMLRRGKIDQPVYGAVMDGREVELRAMQWLDKGIHIDSTAQEYFFQRNQLKSKPEGPFAADRPENVNGIGPLNERVNLPGVWFYKLPHKDSPMSSVFNPLGKCMIPYIQNGDLQSDDPDNLRLITAFNSMCSYWKNNRDRIVPQMVVSLTCFQDACKITPDDEISVILPRVVCVGTVTRRSVEPTWMTVSNPEVFFLLISILQLYFIYAVFQPDRIGSELRGLIIAPKGYRFVGADVDSQELWIAALFSDSYGVKIHGSTPISWILLKGDKSKGTDQHSLTAKEMGVSRSQAKILNYGRIYGAGRPFATRLLKTFLPTLSDEDVKKMARKLYRKTKGSAVYLRELTEKGRTAVKLLKKEHNVDIMLYDGEFIKESDIGELLSVGSFEEEDVVSSKFRLWTGGSESDLFNALEKIARSPQPRTPILGCRISRALEPDVVNEDFLTSRINWVVQSSAVDYLHLMLVCMKWLCDTYGIEARFTISIHDEVRYLTKEDDMYRTALALQYTNLLTRAFFSFKTGLKSLPSSVAFFSKIDIDHVLRKEVDVDCTTPSNPFGLTTCYNIPFGESYSIEDIIEKAAQGFLKH
ncbi:DNA polymerase subunit gamma-1 [Trichinella patagoniensis]|uniref:DNA-directed DNA polymerase n=1 Tax=Trichinella patagoniensis TaxID=990121 RepID=A0A0V0ZK31_9BILA|nr:DNA polymerase subunit gamma-1 [Trichinella patagoniensis]